MSDEVFEIPRGAVFDITEEGIVLGNKSHVVIHGSMGRKIAKIYSEEGSVTLDLPSTETCEIKGIEAAHGMVKLAGNIKTNSIKAESVEVSSGKLQVKSIISQRRIEFKGNEIQSYLLMAPEIQFTPETRGRAMIVECQNELGPSRVKGCFGLDEYMELQPGVQQVLQSEIAAIQRRLMYKPLVQVETEKSSPPAKDVTPKDWSAEINSSMAPAASLTHAPEIMATPPAPVEMKPAPPPAVTEHVQVPSVVENVWPEIQFPPSSSKEEEPVQGASPSTPEPQSILESAPQTPIEEPVAHEPPPTPIEEPRESEMDDQEESVQVVGSAEDIERLGDTYSSSSMAQVRAMPQADTAPGPEPETAQAGEPARSSALEHDPGDPIAGQLAELFGAIENAYSVEPPPVLGEIRDLIQRKAYSVFYSQISTLYSQLRQHHSAKGQPVPEDVTRNFQRISEVLALNAMI